MLTRSKFQNVQLASMKESNTRDVSEGLHDTIFFIVDDSGSPALHTWPVSHFEFASSHFWET